MATGTSLLLIAIGAILRYAITAHVSWINLTTVDLVLMIVGIVGLVLSLLELFVWTPRRSRSPVDDRYSTADPGP
jgi:heme/copper-type cytochrome/quinol oxidase subunit 2